MTRIGDDGAITVTGINIQWPWSQLLLSGKKTVETRGYPLPEAYRGQWLALIETPGPKGRQSAGIHQARIQGLIVFAESFLYRDRNHWLSDRDRHLVSTDDPLYSYQPGSEKWGWVVQGILLFPGPLKAPLRKGIVFTRNCSIRLSPDDFIQSGAQRISFFDTV